MRYRTIALTITDSDSVGPVSASGVPVVSRPMHRMPSHNYAFIFDSFVKSAEN